MVDNYLALGSLIRERLHPLLESWPTLSILSARDLAGINDATERLPALYVIYMGDRLLDAVAGQGRVQKVNQVWCVIVSHRDLRDTLDAQASIGDLITCVLEALQGWQPPPTATDGPLLRVQAPDPVYQQGVMRVPLYFQARVLSRGVPCAD